MELLTIFTENDNVKAAKLDVIKNSEIDFEIDFDDNVLTDFQAISASTLDSINFFDFENIKSILRVLNFFN